LIFGCVGCGCLTYVLLHFAVVSGWLIKLMLIIPCCHLFWFGRMMMMLCWLFRNLPCPDFSSWFCWFDYWMLLCSRAVDLNDEWWWMLLYASQVFVLLSITIAMFVWISWWYDELWNGACCPVVAKP
jgi:hypothetical protein